MDGTNSPRRRKIFGILSILIFILFWFAFSYFVGRPMLQFVGEPETFRAWIDSHGFLGRLGFLGMLVIQVIVAIIPGEPLEICAGYAFGFWEGTLLCIIGTVIGSTLVFLFTRMWGMKVVEIFFSQEKIMSLRFLRDAKKLNTLTFILFLIPGTPKDILTYCAGLTTIPMIRFLWISGIARVPSIVTSTIGGDALGGENYIFAVIVFAATALLSIAGVIVYKKITEYHDRRRNKGEQDKKADDK